MASYTIISNALSGEYTDKHTNETVLFENKTFHPGLLQYGFSRFCVRFTNDLGDYVEHEHEVNSTDPIEIENQLKLTLTEYNSRNGNYLVPDLIVGEQVNL